MTNRARTGTGRQARPSSAMLPYPALGSMFWSVLLAFAFQHGNLACAEDLPAEASPPADRDVTPADFDCLQDWAMVGHTRYKSLNDRLPEVLAVAAAPQGKSFPVGTLVMLQPSEAMLKRAPGSNPATDDWEYLKLAIKKGQVEILERGGPEVKNIAGSCNDCHTTPGADRICANAPGCKPLPNFVVKAALKAVATDPRCADAPRKPTPQAP